MKRRRNGSIASCANATNCGPALLSLGATIIQQQAFCSPAPRVKKTFLVFVMFRVIWWIDLPSNERLDPRNTTKLRSKRRMPTNGHNFCGTPLSLQRECRSGRWAPPESGQAELRVIRKDALRRGLPALFCFQDPLELAAGQPCIPTARLRRLRQVNRFTSIAARAKLIKTNRKT